MATISGCLGIKDMGVLLGHRRKMLAAIGELSSQPAAARAPATGTPIGSVAIPTASPNRASQRALTYQWAHRDLQVNSVGTHVALRCTAERAADARQSRSGPARSDCEDGKPNGPVCSDQLDGSAFGLSRSGGRTASSKSQRRHFQVSTVMGRDLLITCDLVITMVIPQLGHVLSGGGLSG